MHLCESCYDRHYTTCESCGTLIRNNEAWYEGENADDGPYCYDCHCRRGTTIHEFYYNPEPIFYGSGPRFFGVELEIDEAGECSDKAEEIEDAVNGDGFEHVYIKHDGSLEDGLESSRILCPWSTI